MEEGFHSEIVVNTDETIESMRKLKIFVFINDYETAGIVESLRNIENCINKAKNKHFIKTIMDYLN